MRTHNTLGPLASIEGHTPDGRYYTIRAADVETKTDGEVTRCVLFSNTPDLVHDENGKLDLVYPTKTRPLHTPSQAIRNALELPYTALHEGRSPDGYLWDKPRIGESQASFALIIDAASYVKPTRESTLHLYRHPIELSENSKPTLAISKNQELWFRNQDSVRVTERGIEDIMTSKEVARVNPYTQENIQRAFMSSAYAGVAGLGWTMLVNYTIASVPMLRDNLTGYKGAAAKVAAGVLVAVGIDGMLTEEQRQFRPVAAGIGVGGVIGGGMQAWQTYMDANPTTAAVTPPVFTTRADYDAWVAAHPGVTVTQARPPAGVSDAGFGRQWSGQGGRPAQRAWGKTG